MFAKIALISLILFTFNFLILGAGYWFANKVYVGFSISKNSWLELLSVGAGFVVLLLGLFGVLIVILPYSLRSGFAIGGLLSLVGFNSYLLYSRKLISEHKKAPIAQIMFYMGFICLTVISIFLANLPVKLPSNLIDGPYVAKADVLPVRVQFITGNLPADNSIPHVVSEYLLRDISFEDNRPILPGQEVSNRTILMSLAAIPFNAALEMPQQFKVMLPTFSYVGSNWPDFRILIAETLSYEVSLVCGIIFNALMILGVAAFLGSILPLSISFSAVCIVTVLSSPYFLFQTLFIWPKSMAGFYIALSLLLVLRRKAYFLGGIFAGAAYLSHPYAIIFIASLFFWVGLNCLLGMTQRGVTLKQRVVNAVYSMWPLLYFCIALALLLAPWFVWTKLLIHLPASNLVEQNLFISGQSLVNFIWIRAVNFSATFMPVYSLAYPFNFRQFIWASSVNAVGAAGFLIYIFFLKYIFSLSAKKVAKYVITIAIPSALIVFIFSIPTVPALHGLQLPILLMVFLGCFQILTSFGRIWGAAILGFQSVINIFFLERYFYGLL